MRIWLVLLLLIPASLFGQPKYVGKFFGDGVGVTNINADNINSGTITRPVQTTGSVVAASLSASNNTTFKSVTIPLTASFMSTTGHSLVIGDGGSYISTNSPNPVDPLQFETNGSVNGAFNVIIGMGSGLSNRAGNLNVFVGAEAGRDNTIGDQNTFVGAASGQATTEGYHNTFFGAGAGQANTVGSYNNIFGTDAGLNFTNSFYNTFGGVSSGGGVRNGSFNSFYGYGAGLLAYSVSNSVAVGQLALSSDLGGFGQVAVGPFALYDANLSATGSGFNTVVGYNSGRGIVTGTQNTIIGAAVTGLPSDLNNNVIIASGDGSQRINANSSGYVGIGTGTNVQSVFHIVRGDSAWGGFNDAGALWISGTTDRAKRLEITYDTSGNYGLLQAGQALVEYRPLSLQPSGGNVGIGVTAPGSALTVAGEVAANALRATNGVVGGTFTGNGSGLTNLNTSFTGTVTSTNYVLLSPQWIDVPMNYGFSVLGPNAPALAAVTNGSVIQGLAFDNNDILYAQGQMQHNIATTNALFPSQYIEPHVHFSTAGTLDATHSNVTWRVEWEVASITGDYSSRGTNSVTVGVAANGRHYMAELGHITNNPPLGISAIFRCRLMRPASVAQDYSNSHDVIMDAFDLHIPVGNVVAIGSRQDSAQ